MQQALPLHAPLVHVEEELSKKHPCASRAQFASVEVLEQVAAADLHTGSALHVQAAEPAAPVQLWCVLAQAAGAP